MHRTATRTIVGTVSAAVLLLCGCGGGATAVGRPTSVASATRASVAPLTPTPRRTPTPTATPTENRVLLPGPAPVDYKLQQGAASLQIKTFSWQRTGNGPNSAPPTGRYLVLDVLVTAREGKVLVNPLYFAAVAPNQAPLTPTMGSDGNEPVLSSRELKPGDWWAGVVSFDAPPGPITIVINDELGNKVGEVPLPAPAN
ncbi:hypothetical protein CGZ93_15875 [Enemella dayhoffiae]|uniref:DUF4352 domain-containing protein n=1 Tax=Enemella dayhoffiae TaxID=2016507 RepID=A0A255GWV4_9ACTN|nr:hypothetical protein [Enemella dayhoffiae]OYO18044.1 hypothetical protein CGZ93_15875 [Enemella dayhoffiae]